MKEIIIIYINLLLELITVLFKLVGDNINVNINNMLNRYI